MTTHGKEPQVEIIDYEANDVTSDAVRSWVSEVMTTLDHLLADGDVTLRNQLVDMVMGSDIGAALRFRIISETVNSASANGARLQLGMFYADDGRESFDANLSRLTAIATATTDMIHRLNHVAQDDEQAYRQAIAHLEFFWGLLRGFLWSANTVNGPIPRYFADHLEVWCEIDATFNEARTILIEDIDMTTYLDRPDVLLDSADELLDTFRANIASQRADTTEQGRITRPLH